MIPKQELDRIIQESSRKLLQTAAPPIKCWLLEFVLHKDREDAAMQKALAEAEHYPPRVKLLSTLREDGTWPISKQRKAVEDGGPGPPFGWTSVTVLRNLYMLYEYFAPLDARNIDAALESILSWQHEDGYIMGPEQDMLPRPSHIGLAMCVLHRFEKQRDPRVGRLIKWLLDNQRHDGGWNIPYIQDARYRPEYRFMRMSDFIKLVRKGNVPECGEEEASKIPSCIWSSLGAIRGFAWSKPHFRDKNVRRGGDFVLNNFFRRNYHTNFNYSERNWTMLKFPVHHGSGLTALDCLGYLGFGPYDERMEKPIRWLISMRKSDGYWYRSVRPHHLDDQWVTVTVLEVLSYYARGY